MHVLTPAGRMVTVTRHTGGLYAIDGPNVTGYRFHGGDALRAAQTAAERDVPADVLTSRIPRGPIVRSAIPADATRHQREGFPRAHRDSVRGIVETIVLQGDPPGERDSRYSDARYRAIGKRADSERAFRAAWTLGRCLYGPPSDPATDPHKHAGYNRLPYCDPVVTAHAAAIGRIGGSARDYSRQGDSTARVRAHRARAALAPTGADADLQALRDAAARAAGGADALSFRMAPAARIPLAAHPTR